uniref:Uncharacterized protein n=1 Tax=viral metagenome TaxID=1070528 RepID=A0A6C0BFI5_9ZZZZ
MAYATLQILSNIIAWISDGTHLSEIASDVHDLTECIDRVSEFT